MTSNNVCDVVTVEFCNNDSLGCFFNPIAEEGEEPYFYQWLSEGDDTDDDNNWRDVCDSMRVFYADCDEWLSWGVDCDDGEIMGVDLQNSLEEWGDTDEIPF